MGQGLTPILVLGEPWAPEVYDWAEAGNHVLFVNGY